MESRTWRTKSSFPFSSGSCDGNATGGLNTHPAPPRQTTAEYKGIAGNEMVSRSRTEYADPDALRTPTRHHRRDHRGSGPLVDTALRRRGDWRADGHAGSHRLAPRGDRTAGKIDGN